MATNNRNNARFLQKQRPKLKKRLMDHLTLREDGLKKILQQTVKHLNELGYPSTIAIPDYDESFVNMDEINKLIDNWRGLHISRVIAEGVFHSKSVNWLDQNSRKVSGPYFFALHLKEIKCYLLNYCKHIDVSQNKRKHLVNYSCIYFVVQLLSAEIKGFVRCKPQHLMRNTTLAKSKDLHKAFQCLYDLNLPELVKIVKNNNKILQKKKQNRIDCKRFAQNFGMYCRNLLGEEKVKLGLDENNENSNNVLMPIYFRDLQRGESSYEMEIDEKKENSIPTQQLLQNNTSDHDDAYEDEYEYGNCACTPYPMIPQIANDAYYNPPNYYNYPQYAPYPQYYQYEAPYYGQQRGGYYIGATGHFRYNPYILPPIAPNNYYNAMLPSPDLPSFDE